MYGLKESFTHGSPPWCTSVNLRNAEVKQRLLTAS